MMPLAVQTSYYAVVAQVLPVLLLVLIVGPTRLRSRTSEFDRAFVMATLLFVVVITFGELCALRILAGGAETQLLRGAIAISLSIAIGMVVMRFVHSLLSDFDPSAAHEDRSPEHFWLLAAFGSITTFGSFALLTVGT